MELVNKEIYKKIDKEDIEAVILGGGYGKGEGGVYKIKGKEYLFNDYDFFIITKNISNKKKKKFKAILLEISEKLTSKIGIDVDFGPLKCVNDIKRMPFTQMWGELKFGHKVISGNKNVMKNYPFTNLDEIPETEALKMLLNRGVGLLLAENRLKNHTLSREDIDFISRNIFKSGLCIGDSILIMQQRFHHSYLKRQEMLNNMDDPKIIQKNKVDIIYKDSLQFKLQPDHGFTKDKLIQLHKLYKKTFKDIYFYLFSQYINKFLNEDLFKSYEKLLKINIRGSKTKNLFLNIRDFRLDLFNIKHFFKYPRVRLFYVLPYLMYPEDKEKFKNIKQILGLDNRSSKKDIKMRFLYLWGKYN